MTDFYQKRGQRAYIVYETAFGTPKGGSAFTALGADNPFAIPLSLIGESVEIPYAVIKKLPKFDISDGKYPSIIVDGQIEPVEISLTTEMQSGIMVAYAVGDAVSTALSGQEVNTITCVADDADSLDGKYFFVEVISSASAVTRYCVWIDVDDSGTADPTPTGCTSCEVNSITTGMTAAQVASEIAGDINALSDVGAASDGAVVTVTNAENGAVIDAYDGNTTGFAFANTTQGVSTTVVTEKVDHNLKSFTLHLEKRDMSGSSKDIYYDIFGCVVDVIEIVIDKGNDTIQCNITIKGVYAVPGNELTATIPANAISAFTWNHLDNSTYPVLKTSSTVLTPDSVNKVSLTINNNIKFLPDISVRYMKFVIAGRREIKLNLVGFTQTNDLFNFWKDTWNNADEYYETATGVIYSMLYIARSSSDFVFIPIYNLMIDTHNLHFASIDDVIAGIDVTLVPAQPYSDGRQFVCAAAVGDYAIGDDIQIKDKFGYSYYHMANS